MTQTLIATIIVLISAAYLLRMWLPVFHAKKSAQLASEAGLHAGPASSQRAACAACNASIAARSAVVKVDSTVFISRSFLVGFWTRPR